MVHIARWTMAHRRTVVVAWIVAAIGIFAVSNTVGKKTASSFTLPGTGSQQAVDLLQSHFPAQAGDADQIVFHAMTGTLTDAADRAAIAATLTRVAGLPHVTSVVSPYAPGEHAISRDGTIAFATVNFDERANALPKAAVDSVITVAESARSATLDVQLGGQAIEQAQQASLGFATVVGIAAAIVILLISFGSFSAMGLPIATALLGLGAGIGVINVTSHLIDMPSFATELALMIGLGVGVDYALFIVTRFRESYRTNGGDVEQAVQAAINTSGRAVLFAGATVVIALLGMFALGVSLLNGAAVAASIGVVLVMAASLTLLPALLSLIGPRIGRAARRQAGGGTDATRPAFWLRWVQRVQKRPAVTAIAATALMLALAAPALGLRLASSDAGSDPAGHTTRQAFDLLAKGFGPGFNGPLQIAVALPQARNAAALTELTHALSDTPGITSVAPPRLNATGTTAAVVAYPTTSPQSAQTSDVVTPAAQWRDPADRARHRHPRVCRWRHGGPGGLFPRARDQVAAVHWGRGRDGGAAAAGGLPVARHPRPGRVDESALDRGVTRDHPGSVRAGLGRRPVRRAGRTDRRVHPSAYVRDCVRTVDGLRGVPRLPRTGGMAGPP